jgi:hypothetical protein
MGKLILIIAAIAGVTPTFAARNCMVNGQVVKNGGVYTYYSSPTVYKPKTCASVSQKKVCTNGVMKGTARFQYTKCREKTDNTGITNNSGIYTNSNSTDITCAFGLKVLKEGESVKAYKNPFVSDLSQCTSEMRVCKNGVLSGTYSSDACGIIPR